MTAPEPKTCPFCLGKAEVFYIANHEGGLARCADADCIGNRAYGKVSAWNRRADLAAVQPAQVPETCGKCMGSEYGGHPDSGQLCADCNGSGGVEPQPDQTVEIDLRAAMMEELEKAASESPWVPKEYYMNEVISDCCAFLREDRTQRPDPRDEVVKMMPEVIAALRSDGLNVSLVSDLVAALAAAEVVQK